MPAGEEKKLFPVKFWRLTCGGAEADGLFMSAQLPQLSYSNADLEHVGQKASPEKTSVNVHHTWSDLSLQRGLDKKGTLWKWVEEGLPDKGGGMGKMTKKEMTVELCDSTDAPVQTWSFVGAWPSSYTGPGLSTSDGSYAVESIGFSFDNVTVKFAGG